MSRHVNIPIFIPHEGCKNDCVFCDQRSITGVSGRAQRDIRPEIDKALSTIEPDADVEIAFFGGSFTGIGIPLMTRLCDQAYEYVKRGRVRSVRLSTRPDYIDESILEILYARGVTDIELGIQSMSDEVLYASGRGHTANDTERACRLIKQYGFTLTGQMMIGLPKSDLESELLTAKKIVQMGADSARIYPTVVFYGTKLCRMAQNGEYEPLSLETAVKRSAAVYGVFRQSEVRVLRIGLHSSDELSDSSRVYAGPNHPALGELVLGEYFYGLLEKKIPDMLLCAKDIIGDVQIIIFCSSSAASKISGQNGRNKKRLLEALKSQNGSITDIQILASLTGGDEKITVGAQNTRKNGKARRKTNCI